MPRIALPACLLLLTACAAGPRFDTGGVMVSVTPDQAAARMSRLEGARVLWGGTILSARNREETTRLEILAYPLDDRQRPRTGKEAGHRFVAIHEGYLETADYSPGRQVTVKGPLVGKREGKVGKAPYTYPMMKAERIHLWPKPNRGARPPRFHFGLGVLFGT